jgi:hypothetical protein
VTGERRILFYSDNGHGLGHITRLMAMARRLGPSSDALFLTMSESHELVRRCGFPVEYAPSPSKLGLRRIEWDELFALRLTEMIDAFGPHCIVIDHVNPPRLFARIATEHPRIALVWSRRGLWRDDRNRRSFELHSSLDAIVEPMDLASPVDQGDTVRFADAVRVGPITFTGPDELVAREEARRELGLPQEGTAVLLQMSADTPDALRALVTSVRDLVRSVDPTAHLFAPLHVLHAHALEPVPGVSMRPVYPVARYLQAFDAAISTAGYNSFHELLMAAVPTMFVARSTDSLDHQDLRASFVHRAGAAIHVPALPTPDDTSAVARLLDPRQWPRFRAAATALYPGNGAVEAASLLEAIAPRRTPDGAIPDAEPATRARRLQRGIREFRSGNVDPSSYPEPPPSVLIDAVDVDERGLDALTEHLLELQADPPSWRPVLAVSGVATTALSRSGLQYETILDRDGLSALDRRADHERYRAARLAAMAERYGAAQVWRADATGSVSAAPHPSYTGMERP